MKRKSIAFSLLFVAIIIIGIVFFTWEDKSQENFNIPPELKNSKTRKISNIDITNDNFEKINPGENFCIYYFPGECPKFSEDILLVENTEYGKKYYLPQTKCLIKMPSEHEWTKKSDTLVYFFKEGFLDNKKDD